MVLKSVKNEGWPGTSCALRAHFFLPRYLVVTDGIFSVR